MRITALPLPHLHDAVILPGSFHHQVTLLDGVGEGLLHIDILSCLASVDGREAMPVIRCAHDHHIDILVIDHSPPIFIQVGYPFATFLLHISGPFIKPLIIHVAQGYTLHLWIVQEGAEVAIAHTAASDQGHFHFITGSGLSIEGIIGTDQRGGTQATYDQSCFLHKRTSIHDITYFVFTCSANLRTFTENPKYLYCFSNPALLFL